MSSAPIGLFWSGLFCSSSLFWGSCVSVSESSIWSLASRCQAAEGYNSGISARRILFCGQQFSLALFLTVWLPLNLLWISCLFFLLKLAKLDSTVCNLADIPSPFLYVLHGSHSRLLCTAVEIVHCTTMKDTIQIGWTMFPYKLLSSWKPLGYHSALLLLLPCLVLTPQSVHAPPMCDGRIFYKDYNSFSPHDLLQEIIALLGCTFFSTDP